MKLDIKNLKKQIIYRCTYSGSKENELLYKKFFLNNIDKFNYSELNQIYIIFNNLSDPEIYNMAIEKLGLAPKDCLILEDNEHGIQAVERCGANLMQIDEVSEVNYINIIRKIKLIEGKC